jgi:tRNA(adenine34) deaminase
MSMALREAEVALAEGEVPVGAVLVRGGTVLAADHNRREARSDPTAHAEMLVLRQAGAATRNWRLTDGVLYVTLEPCPMCAAAIVEARLRRVVFGAQDPRRGALGSLVNLPALMQGERSVEVIGGVLEEDCEALLRRFFSSRRQDVGRDV